jgi:hypothetical protein
MRNLTVVITQVLSTLPIPTEEDWKIQPNNLIVLRAELTILLRKSDYYPVEAGPELWNTLAQCLYRYMPLPTATPWAKAVSDIMTGVVIQ